MCMCVTSCDRFVVNSEPVIFSYRCQIIVHKTFGKNKMSPRVYVMTQQYVSLAIFQGLEGLTRRIL